MCKIIECKWTKNEIESYMKCLLDQIIIIARKYVSVRFNCGLIVEKADFYFKKILQHTNSEKVINDALHYYKKIITMHSILSIGAYKECED